MPIRRVKQQSDRGNIKDLQNGDDENMPPTTYELRVKELYEHAMVTRDQALLESLGLIPMNGDSKNPISIFRHREYINSLNHKLADKIAQTKEELSECFKIDYSDIPQELKLSRYKQQMSAQAILGDQDMVKIADANGGHHIKPLRSFRRVI